MAQYVRPTVDFTISLVGENTGKEFIGTFTAKTKLSIKETLKENEIFRQIVGVNSKDADDLAKTLGMATSYLMVRIVRSPDWWASLNYGLDVEDMNLLSEVNNQCRKAIDDEYKALSNAATDAEKALKALEEKNK